MTALVYLLLASHIALAICFVLRSRDQAAFNKSTRRGLEIIDEKMTATNLRNDRKFYILGYYQAAKKNVKDYLGPLPPVNGEGVLTAQQIADNVKNYSTPPIPQ